MVFAQLATLDRLLVVPILLPAAGVIPPRLHRSPRIRRDVHVAPCGGHAHRVDASQHPEIADRATIRALVASVAGADYSIAVTHQLDAALFSLLQDKVDLVLGAHTHGGQVNPVLGVTHVAPARLETEFIDGRYQRGATTIIITAGVGFSIVPFRYAAPGSIELIELSP